jgi:AcrR family transcriptional regulator
MRRGSRPIGRRERAKQDKRERIVAAARELFARHGVGAVTTQQIADRAGVAIGTLYLYASTKAELLIMVQNVKFAAAIDEGLAASRAVGSSSAVGSSGAVGTGGGLEGVVALVRPVVACVREHLENGRMYLHELVFGDPVEPNRREGLTLSARLEDGIADLLCRGESLDAAEAATFARMITAIIHLGATATVYLDRSDDAVLAVIREQIRATLALHQAAV